MELVFKTKKLNRLFNSNAHLEHRWGVICGAKIRIRMAAIRAATSLQDFWPPTLGPERCQELAGGNRRGQLCMDLEYPHRLIFTPTHSPVTTKIERQLDWRQVTVVTILGVEEMHG